MNALPPVGPQQNTRKANGTGRLLLVGLGVILAAALFLWMEHWAYLFFALPFLFLLACPLMHMFMHHGHGGHGTANDEQSDHAPMTAHSRHDDSDAD